MSRAGADASLKAGARELGLALTEEAVAGLVAYLALLERWNRAYNLTAVRHVAEMVPRHLLDSLTVHPYLHGRRIVDVGSGAGLPGIPLAFAAPQRRFTLVEASEKKARFLDQVVLETGLANVTVERVRAEDYRPRAPFDTVVARALAPLPRMVALAGHLCADDGRVLAMKGRRRDAELGEVPESWRVADVHRLRVPGLEGDRHLVELVRTVSEHR